MSENSEIEASGPMHTLGPWYVSPPIPDEEGLRPDTFTIGAFEAKCHHEDTICEVWDGNHNGPANAKLIAAAPELLAALEDLFAMMDEHLLVRDISKDHEGDYAQQMMAFVGRLKKGADAIVKAT